MAIEPWSNFHTRLRDTLEGLADERPTAKQIAADAGLRWGAVDTQGSPRDFWHNIVDYARRQLEISALIDAALKPFPKSEELKCLRDGTLAYRLSPVDVYAVAWKPAVACDSLEKIMGSQSTLLPIGFLEFGLERAKTVVRVAIKTADGQTEFGTGFLVEGNWLVTNHHVIGDAVEACRSIAEFNVEQAFRGRDRTAVPFRLAPESGFATSEEDDWTVVRFDGDPQAEFGAIRLGERTSRVGDHVNIIQHPGGGPKQIAMAHNLVTYADDKRIQYLTDTSPGSSGSPVFNENWEVVALHNSGGWLREPGLKDKVFRNEGIAINVVLEGAKHLLRGS